MELVRMAAAVLLVGGLFAVSAAAYHAKSFDSGLEIRVDRTVGYTPGKLGIAGTASYYTAPYVPSACFGYDSNQFPPGNMFAAGGDGAPNIWNNGANCGRYFGIDCAGAGCWQGSHHIDVKIVDRCPNGCSGGRAFDLSYEAFGAIANRDQGVITVYYGKNPNPDVKYSFNFTGLDLPEEYKHFQRAGVTFD